MTIGIDIDGVIVDLLQCAKSELKKYSFKVNGKKVYNKNADSFTKMYGLTEHQDYIFWFDYIWEYAEKVKVYKNASKYLKLIKEDGHQVILITAREFAGRDNEQGKRMRDIVERRLNEDGIVYDKIIYTSEVKSKLPTLFDNKVDIMIEDAISNLKDIAPHIPSICYYQKYNKNFKMDNVYKCKNWKEVYNTIKKLSMEINGENN